MERNDMIQVILDINKNDYDVKVDNHLNYLIWEEHLKNLPTTKQSHLFLAKQYLCHTSIEFQWEDL